MHRTRRRATAWLVMTLALAILAAAPVPRARGGGETQAILRIEPEIDCPSCEDRIKEVLAKTKGVHRVTVDLMENRLVVRFDPAQCTVGRLLGRIAATGYQARQVK